MTWVNEEIKTLDEAYYDRIIQSGKMFCRKIVSGKSDAVVEIIKRDLKSL